MRLEAAEEDVIVYGAQAAVHGIVGGRFYCNRLHDNAFRDLFLCHGRQSAGGRGTYAEVLIVMQDVNIMAISRVYHIGVREGGRLRGERLADEVMMGETIVQLAEALVVACAAGVQEFVVAAEFYPAAG
jgi:hypothetical protein